MIATQANFHDYRFLIKLNGRKRKINNKKETLLFNPLCFAFAYCFIVSLKPRFLVLAIPVTL